MPRTHPAEEATALSLKGCIELMLANNLDLKVEQYNPDMQEKEIVKEKAAFDPLARFSFRDEKWMISPTTLLNGVLRNKSYEQETINYDAGLSKRFLTGGVGDVSFTTDKYRTNSLWQYESPTYFSQVVFSLNQPLLRNFCIDLNLFKDFDFQDAYRKFPGRSVEDWMSKMVAHSSSSIVNSIWPAGAAGQKRVPAAGSGSHEKKRGAGGSGQAAGH